MLFDETSYVTTKVKSMYLLKTLKTKILLPYLQRVEMKRMLKRENTIDIEKINSKNMTIGVSYYA